MVNVYLHTNRPLTSTFMQHLYFLAQVALRILGYHKQDTSMMPSKIDQMKGSQTGCDKVINSALFL